MANVHLVSRNMLNSGHFNRQHSTNIRVKFLAVPHWKVSGPYAYAYFISTRSLLARTIYIWLHCLPHQAIFQLKTQYVRIRIPHSRFIILYKAQIAHMRTSRYSYHYILCTRNNFVDQSPPLDCMAFHHTEAWDCRIFVRGNSILSHMWPNSSPKIPIRPNPRRLNGRDKCNECNQRYMNKLHTFQNFTLPDSLRSATKTRTQGRWSHGGSCPRCLNSAGAARGQQVAFSPKLHFERRVFFTWIEIENCF
jgi:hypothetical protein